MENYQGLKLEDIAKEWLRRNGGEPEEGDRNTKLYKLATRMRYICDFNEETLVGTLPRYGMGEEELRQLVRSAVGSMRSVSMPRDLSETIKNMKERKALSDEEDDCDEVEATQSAMPQLPPLFKEWYQVAPEDFKEAVVLCQLPILGTLASRLRARYLDGERHSPSFQVSLEAPQASGKSFVRKLVDMELAAVKEHDEAEREKEREYDRKVKELSLTKTKVTKKDKEEILGARPETLVRLVPPTMSITKLLMRMKAAQGLHLFAVSEEVDTVHKAFKRSFSSFSDALRCSFDNAEYGQDYASENSFSGIVNLYYNTLFCGTPKAMCRFYPDLEDGLVSRVLFVTLPDQFGKPMPIWGTFTKAQQTSMDVNLTKLYESSLLGEEVRPEHELKMDWVNKALKAWIAKQQQVAVKYGDRTRDIFCRRSAVVGFRAAMIAWFLWDEKDTHKVRRNVADFAIWVADRMLTQHLLRYKVTEQASNTQTLPEVFEKMNQEFTKEELRAELERQGRKMREREVVYRWSISGLIKKKEANLWQKTAKA